MESTMVTTPIVRPLKPVIAVIGVCGGVFGNLVDCTACRCVLSNNYAKRRRSRYIYPKSATVEVSKACHR